MSIKAKAKEDKNSKRTKDKRHKTTSTNKHTLMHARETDDRE